ncbi:Retrovirus-related Pol polyprotein from transposon RE1 [Vitis vinifera]|uniref:Retrovirus-related Pol polyprotein from transposon RE1 n=1 Tax=Vitis vinifera TaxID=29760 RepID=A0A438H2X2_VITVI|nr:Retrovirus-related Pol polyprotein from transposon RE1 [Vitis vinifera]
MSEEYDALVRNGTWELVPPEDITNLVGCKWIFCIKRNSDGSIDQTSMASNKLPELGITSCVSFCSLPDSRTHTQIHLSFLLTIWLNGFGLKDLGPLSYFLGVEVVPHRLSILLSQRRYIQDLLKWTNMADAKPVLTPLPTSSAAISLTSGTSLFDPTPYRAAVDKELLLYRDSPSLFMASLILFMPFQMRTRLVIKTIILPPVLILFILAGTLSLGVRRSNKLLLAHPQKQNIVLLLLLLLNFVGLVLFFQTLVLA